MAATVVDTGGMVLILLILKLSRKDFGSHHSTYGETKVFVLANN